MTKKSLNVLCLHGWRSCQKVMDFQISVFKHSLEKMSSKSCSFHVMEATFPASGPAEKELVSLFGDIPYFEWWDAQDINADKEQGVKYNGVDESVARIENLVKESGPFDVLLGFSQGSTFASILNAHFHEKQLPIPWKVCVHVSGIVPRDPALKRQLDAMKPLDLPSIFLIGEKDFLREHAKALVPYYLESKCYVHEFAGGHRFPYKSELNYDEITKTIDQLCNC